MSWKPMESIAHRHRATRLSILAAAVMLGACAGLGPRGDGPIAWETIDSDVYSGVMTEMKVVIRDQRNWARLWSEHKGNRHHPFPLPRIDFSEEMVAGIFTGERPNGCHAVRIQRVHRRAGTIIVEYSERTPSGPRICNYAVTHPSHLIALPSSREPIEFIRTPDRPS
ncbi:hypothetical protein RY831_12360 [Noviherbaspirillum sp. CPCC 100848]|uniref:PrcB C-terminal domain-containing protein n=1 Tax=Noviherbaspirillum album TaxID=3080276 RepID=A0ABU6J931_9BURK|nr:hypothetical protein [Noviherbaspirillum sp. CPCC 100848]MEC4719946.1 hypothetical protein [Noviherbaspirillum sp. CPCC 100848]